MCVGDGVVIVRKLSNDKGTARAGVLYRGFSSLKGGIAGLRFPGCRDPTTTPIGVCLSNRFNSGPSSIGTCTTDTFCTISHITDCLRF